MTVRFLLDEQLSPAILAAIRQREPSVDILRVGDELAPPLGSPDSEILRFAQRSRRLLVTGDRRSMPAHLITHLDAGGEHWGVAFIRPGASIGEIVEDLHVIWAVSTAEEWRNREVWIPL